MRHVALMLIYDRDDTVVETLRSARANLAGYGDSVVVCDRDHELGFAGAVAEGWDRVLRLDPRPQYVFHLEGDFVFERPVPLAEMVALLERHERLAQVSLKRQPVNDREVAAGGIVEADPDAFEERSDDLATWVEHSRYWTTNPSVYSTWWCGLRWPQCEHSEGVWTRLLLDSFPEKRFAIWGALTDPPAVEHVGIRCGQGY